MYLAELGIKESLPFYVATRHHLYSMSFNDLARQLGPKLYGKDLVLMADYFGIPRLGRLESLSRKWQNQNFRVRQANAAGAALSKHWQNNEFRKGAIGSLRRKWEDPDFRSKQSEALKYKWQSQVFRGKSSSASSRRFSKRWQDAHFRAAYAAIRAERGKKKRYGIPLNKKDAERILEAYGRFVERVESYTQIVIEVSKETRIWPTYVRKFLDRYLE